MSRRSFCPRRYFPATLARERSRRGREEESRETIDEHLRDENGNWRIHYWDNSSPFAAY